MPIYCFKCECGVTMEKFLSIEDRNNPQTCQCSMVMRRVITAPLITIAPPVGRSRILKHLNQEDGYTLPARPYDRPRMEQALAQGLDPPREVVGRGFGGKNG